MDKREGATSALLVTEHSPDRDSKEGAQELPSRAPNFGSQEASDANGPAQLPQDSTGAAPKEPGDLQKTSSKKTFKRSRFFSAKHPVNRQAARTSFIFRPDVCQNPVDQNLL